VPKHFGDTSYIPPLCPACIFGRQKKRPWRTSARSSSLWCYPSRAGEQTHVDQMVSSHPGLIPQVTGRLTKKWYAGATIFVDEATDYTYVHLMGDITDDETLEAKHAYEQLLHSKGITVKRYHADKGAFAHSKFTEDC
jgi:hypothetical protein